MIYTTEQIDWLRLYRTEGVGPITFYRLLQKYKTASAAIDALPHIVKTKSVSVVSRDDAERELDALSKLGGHMIFAGDETYPLSLSAIEDAPPVLSVIGNIDLLHKQSVAIVGSRNASLNARKLATKMARDLGTADLVVTSGLARGIDTAAHEGALASGTIAVVAGGVDVVYPKENTELYKQICAQGAVISECALGTQPLAQHFPKRNRIVSGLSDGTVVVEANFRSGSLITARMAGEQGRDVMAVPGFPSDPRSEGTNALIRDGVTLVRQAADVLEVVRSFISRPARHSTIFQTDGFSESAEIIEFPVQNVRDVILPELSSTPVNVDEIIRACHLRSAEVHGTLLEMELDGTVLRLPGNRVCLA
ncbi:MAG TPA: DNA-processing protein DprA [Alphaproteobacteria bacterium]|nr:DNA-processing protein DprA [Alphaproteobacteria bacterium]HOO50984.1 DNA-processing protein DprA [Alphaproteobacteria bacterium]